MVETDDDLTADDDDRHAHLPGHLHHLLAFFHVFGDIVVGKGNAVLFEKILRHVAKMTGRRAIDCDRLFSHGF